jgi:hypothetical protein
MMSKYINLIFLTIVFMLNCTLNSLGQKNDSTLQKKKHAIFLVPINIFGEYEDGANNLWLSMGYNINFKRNKNVFGIRTGFIFKSTKARKDMISEIDALYSKGFNILLEHQYFYKKNVFYATDFYFHHTTTYRDEYINYNLINTYSVNRNSIGLIPKIGIYVAEGKYIFYELAFGCGIRYISSNSTNKIDHTKNLGREWFTRKIFDDGNKFAQRIIAQVKIGVNF